MDARVVVKDEWTAWIEVRKFLVWRRVTDRRELQREQAFGRVRWRDTKYINK